ncbi:hypothetical protein ACJX0J_018731, partial [Zea mays]
AVIVHVLRLMPWNFGSHIDDNLLIGTTGYILGLLVMANLVFLLKFKRILLTALQRDNIKAYVNYLMLENHATTYLRLARLNPHDQKMKEIQICILYQLKENLFTVLLIIFLIALPVALGFWLLALTAIELLKGIYIQIIVHIFRLYPIIGVYMGHEY